MEKDFTGRNIDNLGSNNLIELPAITVLSSVSFYVAFGATFGELWHFRQMEFVTANG